MSPSGLLISLGSSTGCFLSWKMPACHKLDLRVLYEDSADNGGWTFIQCARAFEEQTALREQANK